MIANMTEDQFWELVGLLGGVVGDEPVELLTEALSGLDPQKVEAFCAHLASAIRRLARLPLEGLAVADVSDLGGPALPLVGDALEFFLYAVVAAGHESYERVLAHPDSATEHVWDSGEVELLTEMVSSVLWETAGIDWHIEMDPLREDGHAEERGAWYESRRGSMQQGVPRAYSRTAMGVDRAIIASREWEQWWQSGSLRKLVVSVTVGAQRKRSTVERGRSIVRATFDKDRSYFEGRDESGLTRLAVEEMEVIMATIAEHLAMRNPPAEPLTGLASRT